MSKDLITISKKELDKELNNIIRLKIDDIMNRKMLHLIRTVDNLNVIVRNHAHRLREIIKLLSEVGLWK